MLLKQFDFNAEEVEQIEQLQAMHANGNQHKMLQSLINLFSQKAGAISCNVTIEYGRSLHPCWCSFKTDDIQNACIVFASDALGRDFCSLFKLALHEFHHYHCFTFTRMSIHKDFVENDPIFKLIKTLDIKTLKVLFPESAVSCINKLSPLEYYADCFAFETMKNLMQKTRLSLLKSMLYAELTQKLDNELNHIKKIKNYINIEKTNLSYLTSFNWTLN